MLSVIDKASESTININQLAGRTVSSLLLLSSKTLLLKLGVIVVTGTDAGEVVAYFISPSFH